MVNRHQRDREPQHRRGQHLDDARSVNGPHEERHLHPPEPFGAHRVDGDDEVQSGENRRPADDEEANQRRHYGGRALHAVGSVKSPAGVEAAGLHGKENDDGADEVEVEACDIEARERDVLGPDHDGNEKVAECPRNGRNHEEEHHDDAVHGEQSIVGERVDDRAFGGQMLDAKHEGKSPAERHHQRGRHEEKNPHSLVIGGEQPRADAFVLVDVGGGNR